jgi:antitoxin component YwqK of YwqJK toxin-antitoxin module
MIYFFFLLLLSSCAMQLRDPNQIVSLQVVDRNGFSETIGNKERLLVYQQVDFLSKQPYQKALRVFGKDHEGKSHCKITSYHASGGVWQYLEVVDGRAHGAFKEWHENGQLKIHCRVLDGMADVTPLAQSGWIFDGKSLVWDEEGRLIAEIPYENGLLQGQANYYAKDGTVENTILYDKGVKEGLAKGPWHEEYYAKGRLLDAVYYNSKREKIAEIKNGFGWQAQIEEGRLRALIQYQNGKIEGEVKQFDQEGYLTTLYTIKEDQKHGEEWEFFSHSEKPKLLVSWYEDAIQGFVKTWYESGHLESQKEMSNNKKHGLSFAYYRDGQLMFMEEYDHDKLLRGSYFKKGDKVPISKIEEGFGTATLYNADGYLIQKITYEKGLPISD